MAAVHPGHQLPGPYRKKKKKKYNKVYFACRYGSNDNESTAVTV
jgi:hypothetical protein